MLPRSLKAIRRPRVYSIEELERLFTIGCVHPKHRVFLMTVYGGGLRLGEACRLQPRHIDSARMQIRVEEGKGRKDRYTLLSPRLLQELRDYYRMFRPKEWLFFGRDQNQPLPPATGQKIFYHRPGAGRAARQRRHPQPAPQLCHAPDRVGRRDHRGATAAGPFQPLDHLGLSARAPGAAGPDPKPAPTAAALPSQPALASLSAGLSHGLPRRAGPGAARRGPSLAEVLRAGLPAYARAHRLPAHHWKVLNAIQVCRTPLLGGHQYQCAHCRCAHFAPHACGNRHCPTCQGINSQHWLAAQAEVLLPIPYFHVVFTLPHQLNPLIQQNQAALYDLLFASAAETLLSFGRNNLGAQLGVTAVLHTWSQTLLDHYHLHCIVTGGGPALEGSRWVRSRPDYLFHVRRAEHRLPRQVLRRPPSALRQGQAPVPRPAGAA